MSRSVSAKDLLDEDASVLQLRVVAGATGLPRRITTHRIQKPDPSRAWKHEMFPPESNFPRYQERAVQKMPKMGDISARSALTIHRGTPNRSQKSRPALVLGVDSPTAHNADRHDLQVSQRFLERLPEELRQHLTYRVVDQLEPIRQKHTIEGLMMGEA